MVFGTTEAAPSDTHSHRPGYINTSHLDAAVNTTQKGDSPLPIGAKQTLPNVASGGNRDSRGAPLAHMSWARLAKRVRWPRQAIKEGPVRWKVALRRSSIPA